MKRLIVSMVLVAASAAMLSAQDFKTGYFLDGYTYGYRINPGAELGEDTFTFFSLGIGNLSAEARSKLSLASFMNPSRDAWFVDSSASLADVESNFAKKNSLNVNANVNLLTFGRETDHNRVNFEFNVRSDAYANLPGSFMSALKNAAIGLGTGDWPTGYSFSDVCLDASLYNEIAVGYTHKVNDKLTIGGRVKGLIGLAAFNTDISADVNLINKNTAKEAVAGRLMGNLSIASPMALDFKTFQRQGKNYLDLYSAGADFSTFWANAMANKQRHITGWGAGVDLGATYKPIDGLTVSASVLDLGFMMWERSYAGIYSFQDTIPTGEETDGTLGTEILALETIDGGKNTLALNYTIHLGAKYRMPFNEKLSAGLLGTFQPHYQEARLGVDATPLDFLSLAGSFAVSNYGADLGLAVNFKFPSLNLFVGTDSFVLPSGSSKPLYGTKFKSLITAGLVFTIYPDED